jgi:peptidoglycan/LPS O-acetylase OafA/YrhL
MPPREDPSHLAHLKYRPDIDGLRAVAVLSVVCYHAFPKWMPGGFIGVDIFFVISGYLISTIIFGSLRRIRRIFPALVVVMAATFAAGWWVLLADEFSQLGKHVLASAGFVQNLVLWNEAGYFDTAAESKPLLHLWSLAVEEQFYIFWPLLLGLAWKRKGRAVLIWMAVASALSFLLNVGSVHRSPEAAFYSPLSRIWELAAGAILAYTALRRQPFRSVFHRESTSVAGLLFIALGLVLIHREKAFPGWWALLPVLGACLCIAAGPGAWLNRHLLGSRIAVWFGLISYPLYLWHWPLLAYARVVAGDTPVRSVRMAAVLLAIALAWLTYRWLEKPLRRRAGASVVTGLAAAMLALVALGAFAFLQLWQPRNDAPGLQRVVAASKDWTYPDGLRAATVAGQKVFVVGNGAERVLLLGDSQVEQFGPRAVELARTRPAAIGTVTFAARGACPPVPQVFEDRDPACGERLENLLAFARGPDVDTVVIGACWTCYFDVPEGPLPAGTPTGPDHYYYRDGDSRYALRGGGGVSRALASLAATIKSLRDAGKRVYVLLAIPVGPEFGPRSQLSGSRLGHLRADPMSPTVALPASQRALHDRLHRLAQDSGAEVIDPIPSLCNAQDQCLRSEPDGTPIYIQDGVHLTARYVAQSAGFLDPALLQRR